MAKIGNVKVLGEFTTDYREQRTYLTSRIRKLNEDLITRTGHNVNMLVGFDQFESRRPYGNNLTGILEFISAQLHSKDLKSIVDADFVTRRNFLIKVAESAHVNTDLNPFDTGFSCLCCKFNGVIFVWELNTKRNKPAFSDQIGRNAMLMNKMQIGKQHSQFGGNKLDAGDERVINKPTVDQQRLMYVGKKFETYVTLDHAVVGSGPNINEVPSSNFDYNVVYRSTLSTPNHGSFKIFYSNEEDCKDIHGKFVELTTCNLKRSHNELRYYLRAVFTGQTRLIVGVCNENYLRSIREVNPVKSQQAIRNGTLALNYLSEFLKDLKYQMNFFPEGTFLRFTRGPRESNYVIQHLSDNALYSYNRYVEEFLDLIANHNNS